MRHKCDTSATRKTRVEKIDFDNGTGKNTFSQPYIYYMARERLQEEEQFHTKNYLLEMSCFHAKMRLKSAPQKLIFFYGKSYIKKMYIRL